MRSSATSWCSALALLAIAPAAGRAQDLDSLVLRIGAMSAVTGLEDAMADTLLRLLPDARRDRAGNVVLVRGSGNPVRAAVCPMDEMGYVVGGITSEGYLTLRRVGGTNVGPLYDQFLEGHRVTVFGRSGPVPGVVGVRSTHLTRGRAGGDDPPFSLDNAYVDVGAASAQDVATLGIRMLAPVTRAKRVHRYGARQELVAGPWIAQRAGCAALVSAAQRTRPGSGTMVAAFTARRHFNNDGHAFVLRSYPDAEIRVIDGVRSGSPFGYGPMLSGQTGDRRGQLQFELPVRHYRSPAETVSLRDVQQLEQMVAEWLGGAR